jgi:anti-sigma28 factor (negative regulator of flagellin synthesis)
MGGVREKPSKTRVDRKEAEYTTDAWAAASDEGGRGWRGTAVDTADFLIVHEGMGSPPGEPADEDTERLARLRERIDSGEYAVVPTRLAEAMVKRVERLQPDSDG